MSRLRSRMLMMEPVAASASPLLTDLISYWKLDEASGNAVDAHGTNTLTDNNTVTSAAGIIGTARQFTRTNTESLSISSNASLQTGPISYTFAGWVYWDSTANTQGIVAKDGGGGREYVLQMELDAQISLYVFGSPGVYKSVTVLKPTATAWHFFACGVNLDTNTINIQIDNGTVTSTSLAGFTVGAAGTADFAIGNASGSTFDGRIDELGFWKRVLTSDELTQLYNAGAGLAYPFS